MSTREGAAPETLAANAEPGEHTGGEGSAPVAPVQRSNKPAVDLSQDLDDGEFGKGFRKGARSAKREILEELEREHGAKLPDILTEWKSLKESHAKGEKSESAEVTRLQRHLEKAQAALKDKDAVIAQRDQELNQFRVTQPIQSAVRRIGPKSERYEGILVSEMARRVKLDDDGDLTVLSPEGKPQLRMTLDDLAKEIAETYPDLVTPPRTGTGVKPSAPAVQSRESALPPTSRYSTAAQERQAVLAKLFNQ